MRSTLHTLCFAALVSLPLMAQAQEVGTTQPSPAYFLGRWDCTGFIVDQQNGKTQPVAGSWRFHRWPSGWVTDAFETYAGNGNHYAEWGWSRYYHNKDSFVRHAANTLGGYGQYQAQGWNKDTWIWAGEGQGLSPSASPVVETVTRKGDDHFWISVRFFDAEGTRHDLYKADCRRQAIHYNPDAGKDD